MSSARAATLALALATVAFAADRAQTAVADPASDAPENPASDRYPASAPPTYDDALKQWRSSDEVNDWIGARFRYDNARAQVLSETQRRNVRMPIHGAAALYESPRGVCVDLARFAVETLRVVDAGSRPRYLMIEFDPLTIAGNTLRRHWIVTFERGGQRYFFADSKRPGHIAGPYATTQAFIDDYAAYRGRRIVAFRESETYERQQRTLSVRKLREERD
jgi:hypothetical protein